MHVRNVWDVYFLTAVTSRASDFAWSEERSSSEWLDGASAFAMTIVVMTVT